MANMNTAVYNDLSSTSSKSGTLDMTKNQDRINLQGAGAPTFLQFEFTDYHVDTPIEIVGITLVADVIPQRSH